MEFLNALIGMDEYCYSIINTQWTHPILDSIMPLLTDLHRVPILATYIFPLLLVGWLVWHKQKCAKTLLGMAVAIAIADSTTYHLIKNQVQRDRPEKKMATTILRTHSHSGYSFPSNHAANVFAGAFVIRYMYPGLRSFVYLLAASIAYSRIYVGVHFPLDVTAGALIGYLSGWISITLGQFVRPRNYEYETP